MEWVETVAKTLAEAREMALDRLGVGEDDAEFEILEEPKPGIFGRVRGEAPVPDADLAEQRRVVDAFFAAARDGDFEGLVAVLDPDVVTRGIGGAEGFFEVRGANEVASRAMRFAHLAPYVRPALVNGAAGVVVMPRGRPTAVMGFTVAGGRVVEIDALADPKRLAQLDLTILDA